MTDDTELTVLKTLYRLTAEAICEEEDHRWRELKPVRDPSAAEPDPWISMNSGTWERCLRCGETRLQPGSPGTLSASTRTDSAEFTKSD